MKKRFDQMIVKMIRIWERNGINKIKKKWTRFVGCEGERRLVKVDRGNEQRPET